MEPLQFRAPQALLTIAVLLLGLMATPGVVSAQEQAIPIEYQVVYMCSGEQVIVLRCDRMCAVMYPDRPRRNDIVYETVEEPGSVVEKIQSCQLQREGQPAAQAAPRAPAVAAVALEFASVSAGSAIVEVGILSYSCGVTTAGAAYCW